MTTMSDRHSDLEKSGLGEDHEFELAEDSRVATFTLKEQKAIMWRVDRRLVLTLGFLYLVSLMDRTNLGAAAIAGYVIVLRMVKRIPSKLITSDSRMTTELKMNAKNNAYTIVSVVFFIPYALFQPPATVAIRNIGPRRFLAGIVLGWGAIMIVCALKL